MGTPAFTGGRQSMGRMRGTLLTAFNGLGMHSSIRQRRTGRSVSEPLGISRCGVGSGGTNLLQPGVMLDPSDPRGHGRHLVPEEPGGGGGGEGQSDSCFLLFGTQNS